MLRGMSVLFPQRLTSRNCDAFTCCPRKNPGTGDGADVRVVENWQRNAPIVTSSNAAVETLALTAAGMLMGNDRTIAHEWCVGGQKQLSVEIPLALSNTGGSQRLKDIVLPEVAQSCNDSSSTKHQGSKLKGCIWF